MINIDFPDLQQVSDVLAVKLKGDNATFSGVSIDSRKTDPGNLFVAIKGPNFDGHNFVNAAAKAGAVAAVVDSFVDADLPQLKVADTADSLKHLAKIWREQVKVPVVGITGSNGKTTVKEMASAILSVGAHGLKTLGNLNNEIGVPLTLLRLTSEHKWAVVEMGASHPGEIADLAQLARPTIALVNNVAKAHIEGFGSIDEVARTKGEIFAYLPEDGSAIMPEGSEYMSLWQEQTSAKRKVTFGDDNRADVWFEDNGHQININTHKGSICIDMTFPGYHNKLNATAAAAIACELDLDLTNIKSGLNAIAAVKGRLQMRAHASGAEIIDDTYNANPDSVKAGLDYLGSQDKKTIFVFGDMSELGDDEIEEHEQVGKYAKDLKIDKLYTIGSLSEYASSSFNGNAEHFGDFDSLLRSLEKELDSDSMVLVKGSRFMSMDKVVDKLLEYTR